MCTWDTRKFITRERKRERDTQSVCVSGSFWLYIILYGSCISCYRDAVLPKQCCGLGSPPVRWSILGIGIVGLVCAATGAILGALRVTGRDHIAVSLLMIGKDTHTRKIKYFLLFFIIKKNSNNI